MLNGSNSETYMMHLCSMQVDSSMKENGISVQEYEAVSSDIVLLASNQLNSSSAVKGAQGNGGEEKEGSDNDLVWVDPSACCYALYSKLNSDKVLLQRSPLALPKALKVMQLPKQIIYDLHSFPFLGIAVYKIMKVLLVNLRGRTDAVVCAKSHI